MIVKKLRTQRHWSQEQLATMSGLSLRTIQRIEAGNKASIESLKALASVFEVDISKLKEEVIVIDKESEAWLAEPWYVKFMMVGVKHRKKMVLIEAILVLMGTFFLLFPKDYVSAPLMFLMAYLTTKVVTYIDKKGHW